MPSANEYAWSVLQKISKAPMTGKNWDFYNSTQQDISARIESTISLLSSLSALPPEEVLKYLPSVYRELDALREMAATQMGQQGAADFDLLSTRATMGDRMDRNLPAQQPTRDYFGDGASG
jgi:hypothetical protein